MPNSTQNKAFYSISSLGYCPKVLSAQRLRYRATPTTKRNELAMGEGKLHEEHIVQYLTSEGLVIERGGQCLKCEKLGYDRKGIHLEWSFQNFMLTGHMDGLILADKEGRYFPDLATYKKERPVCEIKTRSQNEFDRWLREGWKGFEDNAYQLTAYMVINRMIHDYTNKVAIDPSYYTRLDDIGNTLKSFFVVKNRNTGEIIKSVQSGTPTKFTYILSKLDGIEYYVGRNELYPEQPNWGSPRCSEYCLFKYLCTLDSDKEIKQYIASDEFTKCSQLWLDGIAMKTKAEQMIEDAEAQLKGFAKTQSKDGTGRVSLSTGLVNVTGYPVKEYLRPASLIQAGWRCVITPAQKNDKDKTNKGSTSA